MRLLPVMIPKTQLESPTRTRSIPRRFATRPLTFQYSNTEDSLILGSTIGSMLRSIPWGVLAGLLTFVTEMTLARATLGHWVPVTTVHVGFYLGLGAVAALVLSLATRLAGAADWSRGSGLVALTFAGLQAPSFVERILQVLPDGVAIAVVGGGIALAGFGLAIGILHLLAGHPPRWFAPGMIGFATAVGIALNRNLFESFFEPKALLADALVGGCVAALTLAARLRPRRPPRALAGIALSAVPATLAMTALAAVSGALAAPDPASDATAPPGATPHVVLFVVDTLREDVFRSVLLGTEEGRAFDAAMAGTVWFSDFIAASPWTVPSMGSIMTGRHPDEHGFGRAEAGSYALRNLAPSVRTLAEALDERGYRTHALVTNDYLRAATGMGRGFDGFESLLGATWKLPLLTVGEQLGLLPPEPYQWAADVRRHLARRLPELAGTGDPLFLWIHMMDPHEPLHEHDELTEDPAGAALSELDRLYRDEVRYTLAECTRMIELLEAHGVWSDSVVVFLSDHGEMLPSDRRRTRVLDHGAFKLYGHGHALYDELVKVPLGIRVPGATGPSRRITALASQVDIYPTVAELQGFSAAGASADAVSLVPWLRGDADAPERPFALVSAMLDGPDQRALRSRTAKLIEHPNGEEPPEYYDLEADPGERRNLATVPSPLVRRAQQQLARQWAKLEPTRETGVTEVDPDTARRLEALGYAR